MDELIFRASEKFENLQIQFILTAQEFQVFYQRFFDRSIELAKEVWGHPKLGEIKQFTSEFIRWFFEISERNANYLITKLNAKNFFDDVFRVLKNEITRSQLICGCTGFFIGAVLGYSYAILSNRSLIIVSQMHGAVCPNYRGTQYTTHLEDVPVPRIEDPDDLIINVKASSVFKIDADICRGYGKHIRKILSRVHYHTKSEFPIILGRSCSGVVMEIGRNVTRFEIGDEVYLTSPYWTQGTTSEVTVAKEHRVAFKPKRLGFEAAAGLPYAGGLAMIFIQNSGITTENATDKNILVCGACTPIGCVIVQYCHLLDVEITATSNLRAAPAAKALGANDIIIIKDEVFSKSDLEIDKSMILEKELDLRDPFDVIFVTIDVGLSKEQLEKYLKPDGIIIYCMPKYLGMERYGLFSGTIYRSCVRLKCFVQNIFGWSYKFGEPDINYRYLDTLAELVDKNALQSVVDTVFHPQDIEQALEHVESPDAIGSTVVTFR